MTPARFAKLPDFLRRDQVVQCLGIPYAAVDELRYELKDLEQEVPPQKIGARRGLSRRMNRKGQGYFKYRRKDVAMIMGEPYSDEFTKRNPNPHPTR